MTKFGLEETTLERLRGIFSRHPGIKNVILYGSRAKGNFKPGSDIDLAITGEGFDSSSLFRVADEIDDLLLPYSVDLAIRGEIDNENLLDHIERVGAEIYRASGTGESNERR